MAAQQNAQEIKGIVKKLQNIDLKDNAIQAYELIQNLKELINDKNSVAHNIESLKTDINQFLDTYNEKLEDLTPRKIGLPSHAEDLKNKIKVLENIKNSDAFDELSELGAKLLRERREAGFHKDSISDAVTSKKRVGFYIPDVIDYINKINEILIRTPIPRIKNSLYSLTKGNYPEGIKVSDDKIYKDFPIFKYIDWTVSNIENIAKEMKKCVKKDEPAKIHYDNYPDTHHKDGTPKTNDELFQSKILELDDRYQEAVYTLLYLLNENIDEYINVVKKRINNAKKSYKDLSPYDYLDKTTADEKKAFLKNQKALDDAQEELDSITKGINYVLKRYNATHENKVEDPDSVLNNENIKKTKELLTEFFRKNKITIKDFLNNYHDIKDANATIFGALNYVYDDNPDIEYLKQNYHLLMTQEYNLVKKILGEGAAKTYLLYMKKIGFKDKAGKFERNNAFKNALNILDKAKQLAELAQKDQQKAEAAKANIENKEEQEYKQEQNRQFRAETEKRRLEDNPRVYGDDYAYTDDDEADDENMISRKNNMANSKPDEEDEYWAAVKKQRAAENAAKRRKAKK